MIDLPVARRLETDRLSYLISELSCHPSVDGEGSLPHNNTDTPLGPLLELRCKVGYQHWIFKLHVPSNAHRFTWTRQ